MFQIFEGSRGVVVVGPFQQLPDMVMLVIWVTPNLKTGNQSETVNIRGFSIRRVSLKITFLILDMRFYRAGLWDSFPPRDDTSGWAIHYATLVTHLVVDLSAYLFFMIPVVSHTNSLWWKLAESFLMEQPSGLPPATEEELQKLVSVDVQELGHECSICREHFKVHRFYTPLDEKNGSMLLHKCTRRWEKRRLQCHHVDTPSTR